MITVVIPAYNEEAGVGETVVRVFATLKEADLVPFEVIVVDDGSDDATAARASEAGASLVTHPHNVGYGQSLKSGIVKAMYDTIVITDADGTYPVERIPSLYAEYQKGFDMIVGARTGKHYSESIFKMPMRQILKFLVQWCAGRSIPDINSGLRIFNRNRVIEYFPHLCDTFSFTTSMTLSYMMTGRFVGYLPIDYDPRIGSSHVRLFRDSARTMQYIVEAIIYYNPMKIFLLASVFCLLLSCFLYAAAFLLELTSLFLLGTGTALLSILVFMLGLVAVQLKQIMDK